MTTTATLKNDYKERIVPALMKEFNYTTVMQVPVLKKLSSTKDSVRQSPIKNHRDRYQ